jgi:hypothetical protein
LIVIETNLVGEFWLVKVEAITIIGEDEGRSWASVS